ncbi:unnamed protein product, partial [Adineta steineri]
SYKKHGGYKEGIRGKGYIVQSLEAALWAFWSNKDSFEKGALDAVNLGDDTDTTAAIYGQLAGAYYGYRKLPDKWMQHMYGQKFIRCLSEWIIYEGQHWSPDSSETLNVPSIQSQSSAMSSSSITDKQNYPEHASGGSSQTRAKSGASHSSIGSTASSRDMERQISTPSGSAQFDNASASSKIQQPGSKHTTHYSTTSSKDHDTSMSSNSAQSPQIKSEPGYFLQRLQTRSGVDEWLMSLGTEYKQYVPCFGEHLIDGFWLLNYVNKESLIKYEVSNEEHRKKILDGIQLLVDECKRLRSSNGN